MLETVTIQNFKSLKDVTVKLQKVNLLIGPNNSGKSNFLKSLIFVNEHMMQRVRPGNTDLNRMYFGQNINHANTAIPPIVFEFKWAGESGNGPNVIYHLELFGYNANNVLVYNELIGVFKNEIPDGRKLEEIDNWIKDINKFFVVFSQNKAYVTKNLASERIKEIIVSEKLHTELSFYSNKGEIIRLVTPHSPGIFVQGLILDELALSFTPSSFFNSIKIYKPDPLKISKESLLLFDKHVNEDCSNLVAFLDNMRDEHPNIWKAIETDLKKCIPEFEGINFGKVSIANGTANGTTMAGQQNSIGKRFGLRDKFGKTYWAEELSEGTIYFLALLAIIHQPDPPKLLLLEEPEKGIHPRRISEVMNFIFRLAEEKDIQIILTTHSTQVVDEFQDIPESVFVFELQDGETKIKNLLTDIIEPDNIKAETKGYPKLDFNKHSLGEHWAIGFLGGVPAK